MEDQAQKMQVTRWDETKDGPLTDTNMIRKLEAMGFGSSDRRIYEAGREFPDHTHDVHKIGAITSGRFQMGVFGQTIIMEPGDTLEVPKEVVHWAKVYGPDTVTFIDAEKRD